MSPTKSDIIDVLKRSKKVKKEDVIEWLNNKFNANLPKSSTWDDIEDFISRKVSVSTLENYAKRKGVI